MQDFILPDIGEGIVECEVVKWLIHEGQHVVEDDPVVEVMTDKALVEIPAKYTGTVTKIYYAEGEIAKVHSPLFSINLDKEVSDPLVGLVKSQKQPGSISVAQNHTEPAFADIKKPYNKVLASPAVRRLARDMTIDLKAVEGTGEKGRVLKDDLYGIPNINENVSDGIGRKNVEVIHGVKAAMAKHMSHAAFTVPHFSVSEEIELDKLIDAKMQLTGIYEQQGLTLSFMPFFIKALSLTLSKFPIINSQVNEECTEITYFDNHNIGVAIDSKLGLLVPNIKAVQQLSLLEITKKYNELVARAKLGKLNNEELKGGTITLSNIGVLGGTVATPIVNTPESAIVALGKIQRLPRFNQQDQVVPVNIMQVSWSGDHRIIDGATMVRFNNLWKSYLENPFTLFFQP